MTIEGIDCVGYARVSTERQAGEGKTSLATQQDEIAQVARRLGRTVGHMYTDPGVSGATASERPAFSDLLADIEASPRAIDPGLILALDQSRWGRFTHPVEGAWVLMRCRLAGWIVRFTAEPDAADPLDLPPALSADVADDIRDFFVDLMERAPAECHPLLTIVLYSLVDANERRALVLLRLARDVGNRGGSSELARVLDGRRDLLPPLDDEDAG